MASTGAQGATSTVKGTVQSGSDWTAITNLLTDDANPSQHSIDGSSGFVTPTTQLHIKDFGFSVPDSATITGVQVAGRGSESTGLGVFGTFLLADGFSSTYGNAQLITLSDATNAAFTPVGGDGQLFGASLTPAIVNGTDFGFLLYYNGVNPGQNFNLEFNWITLEVFYEGGGTMRRNRGLRLGLGLGL